MVGIDFIQLLNSNSNYSNSVQLTFVPTASIQNKQVDPIFGLFSVSTNITIIGINLDINYPDTMYCLIGNQWSKVIDRGYNYASCIAPPSRSIGIVPVKLATHMKEFISGIQYFEYVSEPYIYDIQPTVGGLNSSCLVSGSGFLNLPTMKCVVGGIESETMVISNNLLECRIPFQLRSENYEIEIQTNGQYLIRTGLTFQYINEMYLFSIWPVSGPAFRGNTIVSVFGVGFLNRIDINCYFGDQTTPATMISDEEIKCTAPPHTPGYVNLSVVIDGYEIPAQDILLEYAYYVDVSVSYVTPSIGSILGGYPVYVTGQNFINSTSLGCRFADMESRGIFISTSIMVCICPSQVGKMRLYDPYHVTVEVTVNGFDYSESDIEFTYNPNICDEGSYCLGSTEYLSPNGTFSELNARNFTLCYPGTFQPRQGQSKCVPCPVGYICPDHGLSLPVICPAGQICDIVGLRWSRVSCPSGYFCLPGTKSTSVNQYQRNAFGLGNESLPATSTNGISQRRLLSGWITLESSQNWEESISSWIIDTTTGQGFLNTSSYDWSYQDWPSPATGKSRPINPPEYPCTQVNCYGGVVMEAPIPCPIGYFCRAGVTTSNSIANNFSTPQKCFDGFFCPRGSSSPEGVG
jgi:hypothetical protein